MKRIYEAPTVFVENFMAEEYVAACYYLACERGSNGMNGVENHWDSNEYWPWGSSVTHAPLNTADTCADKTANRVITDKGGIFEKVQERNGEQGWINGNFNYWIDKNDNKKMDNGDVIYWYTLSGDNKRRWNHYGTLQAADADHPNHS